MWFICYKVSGPACPGEQGEREVEVTSLETGRLYLQCSLSAVVYNGWTGVHWGSVCYRHGRTGGLVRQVFTGNLLFASFEGDVAN